MKITQLFKNQVRFWLLIITVTMSACLEIPKKQEPLEEETINSETDVNRDLLLFHLNQLRAQGCLCGDVETPPAAPLKWNTQLSNAAQEHSEDMYLNNFFDHVGSNLSTLDLRVSNTGYLWILLGETIARGNFNEGSVINAWKNSPDHCRIMMSTEFIEIGAGKKGNYWTMVLAK